MDGRNSTGRKISLLNDHCGEPVSASASAPSVVRPRLWTYSSNVNYGVGSQSPNYSSSPSLSSASPHTPPLERSQSSDSRTYQTPSPLTPHFASFDQIPPPFVKQSSSQHLYFQRQSSAKMDDPASSLYPPLTDPAMMPYSMHVNATPQQLQPLPPMLQHNQQPPPPQQQHQQSLSQSRASQSPKSESHVSTASNKQAAQSATNPKKNQYPCPMAKQFNCSDHFTTSGHAARHAKKHTGKKDAYCPECNKAFTRKDNMEQHRRTHQNVRGPSKTTGDNRVKKSATKSSRKSDRMSSVPLEAAVAQLEEEQQQKPQIAPMAPMTAPVPQTLMPSGSAGPYFVNPDPIQPLPQPMPTDFSGRPQLYRSNFANSLDFIPQATPLSDPHELQFNYPSPGLSNGLNTLAMAASGHRRMSEEASNASS